MKVLFAATECAPFFKTGGLGDVAGALPKELAKNQTEVAVVLPFASQMKPEYKEKCEELFHFDVYVGWRKQYCGVKHLELNGVDYYFLDNLNYFGRESLYGYGDDGERFAFFQLALIELMEKIDFIPDILHVNDYHTAMVPFLLKEKYRWINAYQSIKTVLTIHNIEFQGQFSREVLYDWFGMGAERYDDGTVRFNDDVNFMKAGILYADSVTTVSPSYAEEIKTPDFGKGLDVILRMESGKLSGILNGIDYDSNDPAKDTLIFANYDAAHLVGKVENKVQLQKELGLPIRPEVPLIGVVSRLTYQKGFHLVLAEMENLLQFDVQFVLLGTGIYDFENGFRYFGERYPDKCSMNITFDLELAQKIYASSDIFLMPSAFEPCGLSQMISMRYGTLPVVHEVGGLKDTVLPFNPVTGKGTGFGFNNFHSYYLMEALKKAVTVYTESPKIWQGMMKTAMKKDFSWKKSGKLYLKLYQNLL